MRIQVRFCPARLGGGWAGGLTKFREELSPVCLREGKVSSLNLIFGHRSEQVGNMDLDSSPTDSEGLELVLHFCCGGDQGDQLILTCNSHLSESDRCEFK